VSMSSPDANAYDGEFCHIQYGIGICNVRQLWSFVFTRYNSHIFWVIYNCSITTLGNFIQFIYRGENISQIGPNLTHNYIAKCLDSVTRRSDADIVYPYRCFATRAQYMTSQMRSRIEYFMYQAIILQYLSDTLW